MFEKKSFVYDTLNRVTEGMKFATVKYSSEEIPNNNEWAFNSKKEIHVKNSSESLTGMLRNRIYGLVAGDVVEVECEFFPISGDLPKIAIDSSVKLGLANTEGYSYPYNEWKKMNLKFVIPKNAEHYSINVGTFTLDIANFKMRNVRIKVLTKTSVFEDKIDIKKLSLSSDFLAHNSKVFPSEIIKDGNLITLTLNVKKKDGTPFIAQTVYEIATIPHGYKPISGMVFTIADSSDNNNNASGRGWIYEGGTVIVKPYTDMDIISASVTYYSV